MLLALVMFTVAASAAMPPIADRDSGIASALTASVAVRPRRVPAFIYCPQATIVMAKDSWVARLCDWRMGPVTQYYVDVCRYSPETFGTRFWPAKWDGLVSFEHGPGAIAQIFTDRIKDLNMDWSKSRMPRLQDNGMILSAHFCPNDHVCAQIVDSDYDLNIRCLYAGPKDTQAEQKKPPDGGGESYSSRKSPVGTGVYQAPPRPVEVTSPAEPSRLAETTRPTESARPSEPTRPAQTRRPAETALPAVTPRPRSRLSADSQPFVPRRPPRDGGTSSTSTVSQASGHI